MSSKGPRYVEKREVVADGLGIMMHLRGVVGDTGSWVTDPRMILSTFRQTPSSIIQLQHAPPAPPGLAPI
jgi:hypothetical protein